MAVASVSSVSVASVAVASSHITSAVDVSSNAQANALTKQLRRTTIRESRSQNTSRQRSNVITADLNHLLRRARGLSTWRTDPGARHAGYASAAGFCRVTEFGGDCERGDEGAWSGARDVQACIAKCQTCARCAVLSYSRRQDDCSWYAWCDLADTRRPPSTGADYVTLAIRPTFAPPAPERVERHPRAGSVRLAITTLAIGPKAACGLVHWCEHTRLFMSLLPRAWAIETVIVGGEGLVAEETCGGRARVVAVDNELHGAYRHCRRERRKNETLRTLDMHLGSAMIKWQVFSMTEYDLVLFCDVDISLTTREWLARFRAKPDNFAARWRGLVTRMTTRPLCIHADCRANDSWAPALATAGRDHSSPVNTGLFFARPSIPLYRDGIAVLRGCKFTGERGWQNVGSPRALLASGLRASRVDGSALGGGGGNLSDTEAGKKNTWLFAGGEVDQGYFWYMVYLRHDAGAYLDPDAASSHRPMHWWGSGCNGKPWVMGSRTELRRLNRSRPECVAYRYGYLMRTLLADPSASRCARALWAQRREVEELEAADPAAWGSSAGVTLL